MKKHPKIYGNENTFDETEAQEALSRFFSFQTVKIKRGLEKDFEKLIQAKQLELEIDSLQYVRKPLVKSYKYERE